MKSKNNQEKIKSSNENKNYNITYRKGRLNYKNGGYYYGQLKNNKEHGQGIEYYYKNQSNFIKHIGIYVNGEFKEEFNKKIFFPLDKFYYPKYISTINRLKREFYDINYNPICPLGITVGLPKEHDLFEWRFTMAGAKDTSYSGSIFFLKILFPLNYPESAPKIYFLTPIYHANVQLINSELENRGYVSFSPTNNFNPSITVREILTKLYSIFYLVNPTCKRNHLIVDEYKYNRDLYEEKIKYFTKKYANMELEQEHYELEYSWNFDNNDWDFQYPNELIKQAISVNKSELTEKENNNINDFNLKGNNEINLEGKLINVHFDINGKTSIKINFNENELFKSAVEKFYKKVGGDFQIKGELNRENNLFIFNCGKVNGDKTFKENRIFDPAKISVISISEIIFC